MQEIIPELDDSELFTPNYIPVYQILIICFQWAVTLVCWYVKYATNTLDKHTGNILAEALGWTFETRFASVWIPETPC